MYCYVSASRMGEGNSNLFKRRATFFFKDILSRNNENTLITFRNLPLQNHLVNFDQTWQKEFLVKVLQVSSNEGALSFPKGDHSEIAK